MTPKVAVLAVKDLTVNGQQLAQYLDSVEILQGDTYRVTLHGYLDEQDRETFMGALGGFFQPKKFSMSWEGMKLDGTAYAGSLTRGTTAWFGCHSVQAVLDVYPSNKAGTGCSHQWVPGILDPAVMVCLICHHLAKHKLAPPVEVPGGLTYTFTTEHVLEGKPFLVKAFLVKAQPQKQAPLAVVKGKRLIETEQ